MADETMFARLVAAVIANSTRMPPSNYIELDGTTRRYVAVDAALIVRALLAELRTPSEPMIIAACDNTATNANRHEVGLSWRAAIDAILAEAGGSGGA